MKRRQFITLLGGAVTWPLTARAQQAMPVIGWLRSSPTGDIEVNEAAFRPGLNDSGYVEGRNVTIETRWSENQ
jgi:putative ABC transport system substrate-binding protein